MSSEEFQRTCVAMFGEVPVSKALGLSLEYDSDGRAMVRMPRNPRFDHGGADTHGGILATLLDTAGWFTVAAACRGPVVTSDIHVRLLQAAKQRNLVATARIVRLGARSAVAEMSVSSDDGELVAVGTASFAKVAEFGTSQSGR